jgi:O-antigen biosynthesis protein
MDPLVTIVITSYNYGRFVGEAVRSALAQTYRNIEVLVLDNASTDNSRDVINGFVDERLRLVVHAENIGLQANHNAGLRMAKGEFVLLLAADDRLLPTLVEDVLNYRRAHPGVDVVYASVAITDGDGKILHGFDHPAFDGAEYYYGRNELASLLTRDNNVYLPTTLFSKSILDELGYFDEALVLCDYEYDLRMAGAGKTFGHFSTPEALIRFHGDNASGIKNLVATGRQLREFCTILERFTQPRYHDQLAGYGPELRSMVDRKVAEFQRPFPAEFAAMEPALEPLVKNAVASIATVPAISSSTLRGQGLISVVVPYTGRIGPLQRALTSLKAQSYDHWEAIVVRDGAADPSGLIASMGLSGRVRVAATTRVVMGPAGARNIGLGCARGEIVCYLDDDNRFELGYLQALATAFADAGVQVTAGKSRLAVAAENGDIYDVIEAGDGLLPDATVSWVSNRVFLNSIAHRRSCIATSGSFNRTLPLFEDWDFLLRLNRAFPVVRLEKPASIQCLQIGLAGHHLFGRTDSAGWSDFVSRLQNIYVANPPRNQRENDARIAYASGLQPIIQQGVNGRIVPVSILQFAAGLAGPATLEPPIVVSAN